MAIVNIASAATLDLTNHGRVVVLTGSATIDYITGISDGQIVTLIPAGAFSLSGAGNISALASAAVVDQPIVLVQNDGVLYEIGVRGTDAAPTITDFTNAQHDHADAAGGGQITSAAISGTTGSGDVVLAENPTIDELVITGFIRLPGPVYIYSGSGTPEGALAAPEGSTFHRHTGGGAGTTYFVKEGGAATNTGWVGK